MKNCSKCHEIKDFSEFRIDFSRKGGYRGSCKKCENSYSKKYRLLHRERLNELSKRWNEENILKKKSNDISWRKANVQRKKEYDQNWTKKNSWRTRSYRAKRKAIQLRSTPKWLTKDHLILIDMYYKSATYLTEVTGIKWEVDHIIPLQGINCSGLHVPWNLRVITKSENASKCNKL